MLPFTLRIYIDLLHPLLPPVAFTISSKHGLRHPLSPFLFPPFLSSPCSTQSSTSRRLFARSSPHLEAFLQKVSQAVQTHFFNRQHQIYPPRIPLCTLCRKCPGIHNPYQTRLLQNRSRLHRAQELLLQLRKAPLQRSSKQPRRTQL